MCLCVYVCVKGINMNGVLGHDSGLQGYTGPGATWTNEVEDIQIEREE